MGQEKRIVIMGLPGAGKSTFSAKLGKFLKVPVHHLDAHMFLPGGIKRDKEDFIAIQKQILKEPSWIIEGCALSTMELRLSKATACIDFNLSRFLCIWRIFKRLFVHDHTLQDTAEGCSKVFTWEMIKYIWNFDRKKRKEIMSLQQKYPQVDYVTFKNSKEADRYLKASAKNV